MHHRIPCIQIRKKRSALVHGRNNLVSSVDTSAFDTRKNGTQKATRQTSSGSKKIFEKMFKGNFDNYKEKTNPFENVNEKNPYENEKENKDTIPCPYCRKPIDKNSRLCKFCKNPIN